MDDLLLLASDHDLVDFNEDVILNSRRLFFLILVTVRHIPSRFRLPSKFVSAQGRRLREVFGTLILTV